jgi:hypothetical protein
MEGMTLPLLLSILKIMGNIEYYSSYYILMKKA